MKEENEINDELKQLLDALEEHGRNARRQKELGDLLDGLEASGTSLRGGTTKQSTKTQQMDCRAPRCSARNDAKRRKLYPFWWTLGAAAACLAVWLLLKPTAKQVQTTEEEWFAEEVAPVDTTATKAEEITVFEEAVFVEEPIAEVKPVKQKKAKAKEEKLAEEAVQTEEMLDTTKVHTEEPTILPEEPLAVQSPKRRVIQSENLVGYDKRGKPNVEPKTKLDLENKTIFGQPQDPNMKNGMLAMEINLEN
jgi:hypothetical protein